MKTKLKICLENVTRLIMKAFNNEWENKPIGTYRCYCRPKMCESVVFGCLLKMWTTRQNKCIRSHSRSNEISLYLFATPNKHSYIYVHFGSIQWKISTPSDTLWRIDSKFVAVKPLTSGCIDVCKNLQTHRQYLLLSNISKSRRIVKGSPSESEKIK